MIELDPALVDKILTRAQDIGASPEKLLEAILDDYLSVPARPGPPAKLPGQVRRRLTYPSRGKARVIELDLASRPGSPEQGWFGTKLGKGIVWARVRV